MSDNPSFFKLQGAVAREKAETAKQAGNYLSTLEKMKAYQQGTGPELTAEELEQWRADVDRQVAERKLQSGFIDLA